MSVYPSFFGQAACGVILGDFRLYTYHYTVTTRMIPALKMGSEESHFNVSLIVRDKITRQYPQTTTSLKKIEGRSGIEP